MNKQCKVIVLSCMPIAFSAMLLSGCQKSSVPIVQSPVQTTSQGQSMAAIQTPPTISNPSPEPTSTPVEDKSQHEAQVANSVKSDDPTLGKPAAPTAKPTPKPKIDEEDAYQQEKPTLMGLKLGAAKDKVLDRFGKAKKQFVMDEDEDPVDVYDYQDFSIGFNQKNELEFVDIHSEDIDPGLRGVRLGQKSKMQWLY
ncbi:hypothetical protein [Paenibacillus hexagrammi]|uniref:Uncharacterized protein n=1 Tax=Paenibacillus hexagrammi TaxID=2908839 RepID=A0ABY3SDM8_9BACL|nr:hypothetical protein [Paenibacillus sp. YPD9-1]UJF31528.1 hypothetical protein L0M14_17120 [Paenibacillus sp. YPD9-1]